MDIAKIIDLIETALLDSSVSFEKAANGNFREAKWCADRMPESWIVFSIMRATQDCGLAAVPEVRVRHDLEWFETNGEKMEADRTPELKTGGAKIDLFIGDKPQLEERLHLRVALEIKGPKSNWQQFRTDIERLRELHSIAHDKDQAMVFAYVTCPLTELEKEDHDKQVEQATGLKLSEFRISRSILESLATGHCYVYMHIMHSNGHANNIS